MKNGKTEIMTLKVIKVTVMQERGWDTWREIEYNEELIKNRGKNGAIVDYATEDFYFDAETKEFIARGNYKVYKWND